jgi:outer membrane biosynthesis protein TonB
MRSRLPLVLVLLSQLTAAGVNKIPVGKLLDEMIHRSTLAEPGGRPFYLKATIVDRDDNKSEFNGTVEEYWLSPTKWRRVIRLRDFSQTRIVNGDLIYEDNHGDYFPLHDEMLADEIVDPLPKPAVDLLNKLGLEGAEPGSGEGQCMAEKYFNDADGRETRVLLAYDCKTGLLIYLWSPSCCYGVMTDYRKFHKKFVAFATKDDLINIRIDTLRDPENPDEALFAISQPTPPDRQITRKQVSETEARKLIAERAEVSWPKVTKKPNVNSISVDIVIGRDGRVKEAWSHPPVENAIEDATLTAIRKWTFSPQRVDGVPAQIETKLIIPFPAELQSAASAGPDVKPIFDKMRAAGDLRLEGAPGFHMKASFRSEDGAAKGIYEETWIAPNKWRRDVKLNDTSVVEARTEDAFYRTFPGSYAPRLADDVIDSLSFSLPGDNGGDFHDLDWGAVNAKLGNVPLLRLSNGYINPQGKPDALTVLYFVDEKTGLIRGRNHYSTLTVFNDFQSFGEKTVARKLTTLGGDVNRMETNIDTLEPAANVSESIFRISGAKPIFTSGEEDRRFTQPRAIYTVKPSIPGWHGKVTCELNVDEHGHVRGVDVEGTTDDSVIEPIRAALMKWEYDPATINGRPALGLVHVNVE